MKIAKALQKVRNGIAYLTESAVLDFTIELDRLLKAKDISRAELGRRIGSSPAYVTKVLNGQGNLTVKSMVALAHALDARVCIQVEPIRESAMQGRWESVGRIQANRNYISANSVIDTAAANEEWLTVKAA